MARVLGEQTREVIARRGKDFACRRKVFGRAGRAVVVEIVSALVVAAIISTPAVAALIVSTPAATLTGRSETASRPAPPAKGQERPSFLVAVLRGDGVAVPFAAYWQGYWLTPWPQRPSENPADLPTLAEHESAWFVDEGEFARDWYAAGARGRAPLRLRASRVVEVDNHCLKNWGVKTNYPRAKAVAGHHKNVGVVTSGRGELVAPARLDPRAREFAPALALLRREFDAEEDSWLARPEASVYAKLLPARGERARRAPSVTKFYRLDAAAGRRLYYFEAERRYAKPRGAADVACESRSSFGGLLLQEGRGRPRLVERRFVLSDCDGKELISGLPLGLLRDGRRVFLFMQEHGYESESYAILELLADGTLRRLREIYGGAC